jgi:hypothetical protein
MAEQELARITVSAGRRVIGVGAMMILGAMMVYLALAAPPANLLWTVFLIGFGAAALWLSQVMWRATQRDVILTEAGLIDSAGEVMATMDQIARVERGAFAAKPSNGFVVILKEKAPRAWYPGIWWRMGKRLAVGGVTAGSQTRPVADILSFKLTERDQA